MGSVFRWVRRLYLFFAAVTRRLVVLPDGAVPVTLAVGVAFGVAWPAGYTVVAATVGAKAVRIFQVDMSNPSVVTDYEVRLGYGAIGAETWFGPVTYNLASVTLPFPLEVPAGQRLLAQNRDAIGGNNVDVKVLAYTIE